MRRQSKIILTVYRLCNLSAIRPEGAFEIHLSIFLII